MAAKDDLNGSSKFAESAVNLISRKSNGQTLPSRRQSIPKNQPSLIGRLFSTAARLLTWYSIITILFRCPASLDACDEASPRICKPYFEAKLAVEPFVRPYYDVYAAPYVEVVRPYYDTVDRMVIGPARQYAVKYGAPRAEQLKLLTRSQWDKNVQPQLAKAQGVAAEKYAVLLGPHVDGAVAVVRPYVAIARQSALQTHEDVILPSFRFVAPYALQGYAAGSSFVTGTAVPTAIWTWRRVAAFLDGAVWPRLQLLYIDTVEPQLAKIGQRLGRYSDKGQGTKQKTSIQSIAPSSFTKPTSPGSSSKTTASSVVAEETTTTTTTTDAGVSSTGPTATLPPPAVTAAAKLQSHAPIQPPDEPEQGENDERRIARETVAEDLRAWQEKYAKAADEGAAEIELRVEEIATRMIRRQARITGKSLVVQLEKAVETQLAQLQQEIVDVVGAVAEVKAAKAEADEQILAAVRRTGVEIKQKAQAVRSWRDEFSKELEQTVNRAAENHFTILGSIRDLALQKIGMKWAWMEGVTYRDWAKYHQLKGRFDEWENDLEQLIVTHPALEEAQNAAQAVEDEAMLTAQSAAKEPARLKQVAPGKVAALDASDSFDSDATKAAAEAAEAAAVAGVAEPEAVAEAEAGAETVEAEIVETDDTETSTATTATETETQSAEETVGVSEPIDDADIIDIPASSSVAPASTVSAAEETPTEVVEFEKTPAEEDVVEAPAPTAEAGNREAPESELPVDNTLTAVLGDVTILPVAESSDAEAVAVETATPEIEEPVTSAVEDDETTNTTSSTMAENSTASTAAPSDIPSEL
ncbi:hypothetical protein CMQ_2627 [Grosmannia clavigera kw1407]|uniref:Transcription factor hoxa13 n=1 Tax=Grosmannia clavigera (strain kw1407 / UAMH 11150) TaxID=655863 RepID=F0XHA1_GROCL|nr:uncharacterized protein CMQ_2627 [Grosmannia clavigera kw1407]EFX02698.1 hypothetical protein CMQ_2627 [Grosmannia clavigera kw1407]